jgi:molybdopterin-guanine dinucleotide biosynthesis protein A
VYRPKDDAVSGVLGAVLVGGRSSRMGRDKALIEIGGVALVDRLAAVLVDAGCDPVVAVGPAHLAGAVDVAIDRHPGQGPLGAIITALEAAAVHRCAAALVVAVDLPDLDAATVAQLLAASPGASAAPDPVVVMAATDRREPLVALWTVSCMAPLRTQFDNGTRAVHRALDALTVVEVPVDARRVRNANTPDQLRTE